MKIATLTIGDELTNGEILDGNSARIAERLYATGLKVRQQLTVGDNEQDIVEAILLLTERNDAVIVTGGLGPTADDITARAAAKATGRRLVLNEEALTHLRDFFSGCSGEIHQLNEKQALLPSKITVIPNPAGTACGFWLTLNGHYLFFLPGVPVEMERMLAETVIPFLTERFKGRRLEQTRVLKVFGISEAEVEALMVREFGGAVPGMTIAYCVNFPEIHVKIRVEGELPDLVAAELHGAVNRARQALTGYLVAEDNETIDQAVARLFIKTGKSVALAESCTGGLIAKRITDLPGSSRYFREGVVTYSNEAKMRLLEIPGELLEAKGAVSSETARAMAKGIRRLSGSDLALAVTGIAGPDGGTAEKPVGTVFIALADRSSCTAKGFKFSGDRDTIRTITAYTAMDWLRRRLISLT